MLLKGFFRRSTSVPPDPVDLEHLRQDTLVELVLVLLGFGWLTSLRALGYEGRIETLLVPGILVAGALGALLLRRYSFRAARYWLIASLIGGLACEAWFFPNGPVRYFFPLPVVVSSLLVSHPSIFGVASAMSGAYLAVVRHHGVAWF